MSKHLFRVHWTEEAATVRDALPPDRREPPIRYIGNRPVWNGEVVRNTKPKGLFEFERKAGEWTAQECAAHHGVTVDVWMQRSARGTAPRWSRYIGKRPVWDAQVASEWKER